MPGIVVKPRARIFHGHEWVYASEVQKTFGKPEPGDVVSLKDFKDRPLGSAIYNPKSQIIARRFSRRKQDLDQDFFVRRITRALEWRQSAANLDSDLCRLVWSESDGLPGVVVDRYGEHLVLQTLTLAMDQRSEIIAAALAEVLAPASILLRNDSSIRVAEGLEPETRMLFGDAPPPFHVRSPGGVSFEVDLQEGQKTGLYLDQFDNYQGVAKLAEGRRVLDCFTNQGGFALHAALGGAESVIGIDSSAVAVAAAASNAATTGVSNAEWQEANVFDDLKERQAAGEKFDLIVLDPPSFARNKRSLTGAMRGYKEIHLRALKMLDPGGRLATFSCSHHVSRKAFLEMVADAAVDAKCTLRQIATYTQRPDHPISPLIPETEYLHGFAFEVIPAW